MKLARKFSRAKWEQRAGLASHEVPADAITGDLRTACNALSFWRIAPGDDPWWEQAALALASGFDQLDTFDLLWMDEAALNEVALGHTPGDTPVADLVGRHVDVSSLDGHRLLRVAEAVSIAVGTPAACCRIRKAEIRDLLVKAVRSGRLKPTDLKDKVRAEVVKALSPP